MSDIAVRVAGRMKKAQQLALEAIYSPPQESYTQEELAALFGGEIPPELVQKMSEYGWDHVSLELALKTHFTDGMMALWDEDRNKWLRPDGSYQWEAGDFDNYRQLVDEQLGSVPEHTMSDDDVKAWIQWMVINR